MSGMSFVIHNAPNAVRIEIAGSLAGADVETVYQAWQRDAWDDPLKPVTVDITLITEADEHGRALLVIMHRFGAQVTANSARSYAIAQSLVTEAVESAAKPGRFARLIRVFRNDQHKRAKFPPQAEMICRMAAGQQRLNFNLGLVAGQEA